MGKHFVRAFAHGTMFTPMPSKQLKWSCELASLQNQEYYEYAEKHELNQLPGQYSM